MAFDLTKSLAAFAPTLATMLGGPLAGTAVTAIEGAFGLAAGTGIDGITQVVQSGNMTPEIIASVRAEDESHAEKLKQMDIDLVKINTDHEAAMEQSAGADRDSARKREMDVKDSTPHILAYTLIGGFIGISLFQLVALMFFPVQAKEIPPQGWLLIGNISGYLAGEAKQAGAYYFGTTMDSGRKTELLSQAPAIATR